jgi:hypothetical protein
VQEKAFTTRWITRDKNSRALNHHHNKNSKGQSYFLEVINGISKNLYHVKGIVNSGDG